MWLCITLYQRVSPWCCVGVGASLGDGCVSGPHPPVHGTQCLCWADCIRVWGHGVFAYYPVYVVFVWPLVLECIMCVVGVVCAVCQSEAMVVFYSVYVALGHQGLCSLCARPPSPGYHSVVSWVMQQNSSGRLIGAGAPWVSVCVTVPVGFSHTHPFLLFSDCIFEWQRVLGLHCVLR